MSDTKTVTGWASLAAFGINMLTAESCKFSLRLLCDLNAEGRELVADYLGVSLEGFAPPWNSSVNGQPAVASVLFHRSSLDQLAEFAMFRDGAVALVMLAGGGVLGIYNQERLDTWEAHLKRYPQSGALRRNHLPPTSCQSENSRNVHVFTGRAC